MHVEMVYILLAGASLAAVYFCLRLLLLKRAVRQAAGELREITRDLEENRVVKLAVPQKALEELLAEINRNLTEIRKVKIRYGKKERELLNQIENISHDLRTPLTAIIGFLELIDRDSLGFEDRESLEVVKKKSLALKKLTAQFYDLSRLTAQDYQLKLRKIDIGRILRETAIDSYQELKLKNLDVSVDIPDIPVFVRGDEDALERIFQNLLQNAGRYAESVFSVRLTVEQDQVLVCMENDTDKLDRLEAETLFERFYTGDSARKQGSTGLGLPIAKHLAEAMEGRLYARLKETEDKNWLSLCLEVPRLKI